MERGEFSQFDFMTACWDYLQLNINDALESVKIQLSNQSQWLTKDLAKEGLLK
jgi:hypothetical protein